MGSVRSKGRRQNKDTVKAPGGNWVIQTEEILVFYESKSSTNYTTEKLIKGSLVS